MFNKVDISISLRDLAELHVVQRYGCKPYAPALAALTALLVVAQGVPWLILFADTLAAFFRIRILARDPQLFTVFGWIGLFCAIAVWFVFYHLEMRWHSRIFEAERMLEKQRLATIESG